MGWKATAGGGGLEKGVARVTAVPPLFFFFKQIERVTIARRIMVSECKRVFRSWRRGIDFPPSELGRVIEDTSSYVVARFESIGWLRIVIPFSLRGYLFSFLFLSFPSYDASLVPRSRTRYRGCVISEDSSDSSWKVTILLTIGVSIIR